MKKSIICLILFPLIIAGCNNSEENKNNESDSTETIETIQENDTEEKADEELPGKLAEVIKGNMLALEQLKNLKTAIANQDEMKSLKDVEKALKIRDSLIRLLNNNEEFFSYMEEGDRLYEEFEAIGIQVVEAEGMFGFLEQDVILDKVIERVADEPYILLNKIKNLSASTHGSEYPYYDINEEMELIPLAEKMLTKYPAHKYNKEVLEMMGYALHPLTDVHKVSGDYNQYIVGGYDVNAYPGATEIKFHNDFVEKYSESRFAKVVENIISNISTLSSHEFDMLYYISVPDLKSDSVFADQKLNEKLKNLPKDITGEDDSFKYMWLGVDVPHTLTLRDGDENKRVLIYRFFDKKEPAEKSLEKIQKIIPKAELVEYQLTESDKQHKN